jgi:hypothetical protein
MTKKAVTMLREARVVNARQRRNLKALVAIILNAREALDEGNILRAVALLRGNVKYPPSAAEGLDECPEHKTAPYDYVRICRICGKEQEK